MQGGGYDVLEEFVKTFKYFANISKEKACLEGKNILICVRIAQIP